MKAGQTVAVLESPELARARATLAAVVARGRVGAAQRRPTQEPGGKVAGLWTGGRGGRQRRAPRSTRRSPPPGRRSRRSASPRIRREGRGARVTIRAPLAGFVLSRDAVQGQTVARRPRHRRDRRSRAGLLPRPPVREGSGAREGGRARPRSASTPTRARSSTANIETIGRQIDPAARTVTARILVRNHGDLVKVGSLRHGAGRDRTRRRAGEACRGPPLRGHAGRQPGRRVRAPARRRLRAASGDRRAHGRPDGSRS